MFRLDKITSWFYRSLNFCALKKMNWIKNIKWYISFSLKRQSKFILISYSQTWLKYIVSRLNDTYLDLYLMTQQTRRKLQPKHSHASTQSLDLIFPWIFICFLNKLIITYHILINISFQNHINIYVHGNSEIPSFTSLFKFLVFLKQWISLCISIHNSMSVNS